MSRKDPASDDEHEHIPDASLRTLVTPPTHWLPLLCTFEPALLPTALPVISDIVLEDLLVTSTTQGYGVVGLTTPYSVQALALVGDAVLNTAATKALFVLGSEVKAGGAAVSNEAREQL